MTERPLEPPPARGLPRGRLEARRAHFEREIRSPRRRVTRRMTLLIPLAALVLSGGAFAAGLFDKPLSQPDRVQCHATPDLRSRHTAARVGDAPELRSPRALCAAFYERGYLAREGTRPQLTACYDDGIVRVFPAPSAVCQRLGLAPLADRDYRYARERIFRAMDVAEVGLADAQGVSVTQRTDGRTHFFFGDTRCVGLGPAARAVEAALSSAGLHDFRVQADRRLKPDDCATLTGLPDRFDGRTIELEGAGTDLYTDLKMTPDELKARLQAQRRYQARVCDHPLGRRGSKRANDLREALDCHAQRHAGDAGRGNCFNRGELRRFARRVLDNLDLPDWRIQLIGGPPAANRYGRGFLLGQPIIDERIRQVRLELTERCHPPGLPSP